MTFTCDVLVRDPETDMTFRLVRNTASVAQFGEELLDARPAIVVERTFTR